jgi:CheY-like chemotaxis protein
MVDSGEAALDYLKTHDMDLMLLDMIMPPGMNGRETVESDRWRHYLLEAKKLRIM